MYETQSFYGIFYFILSVITYLHFNFQSTYLPILVHYVTPLLTHVPLAIGQSLSCTLKILILFHKKPPFTLSTRNYAHDHCNYTGKRKKRITKETLKSFTQLKNNKLQWESGFKFHLNHINIEGIGHLTKGVGKGNHPNAM